MSQQDGAQCIRIDSGYESISREALQDPRVSFKAIGILTYLISLPTGWHTNIERLGKARPGKEGREAIRTGLQELEDAGYLVRRKHSVNHTWRWTWIYSDNPAALQAALSGDRALSEAS